MKLSSCRKGLCVLAVVTTLFSFTSARLAVMSVDLGGEFMKIAIVKPGVPMETVLNKESSRKTPTMVAFRDGERHFASQAQTTAIKFPPKAFFYLGQIVGRSYDDPQVELYRKRFPFYNLLKDEERGTVLFKIDDDTSYSPEELLGMILEKAREYAQEFAEQEIKDAVITVPAFYNQAERRAVMAAANMVGLNVLQLMSDNAAVALNYGVFRRKNFNSTMQYYMFYDMGATSTTATIVGYNVVKTKEGTLLESNPQLTVKGVGFDRTLGGLEFTLRLRSHLAKAFNNQKKTKTQVEENNRAMAKLFKEAERVKKVLSANNDHTAQVEGLLEEKDFRSPVTRPELEEMCQDLFERVTKPVEEALKVSEITLPEISEVILMGGGTRTPKVQELLLKFLGRSELGKSINTDEAAALGAVYQAAYLGKGFKVKKFGVREGNIYPINVEFEKQKTEESGEKSKVIKRTLFGRMNPFPQKKVMTFNKHTKDFHFDVLYSSLDFLSEADKGSFSKPVISRYNLKGVEDVLSKNKEQAEAKGIKAHFRMDESGLLTLDKVESVFEKNSSADDSGEKSTWSKLGSAIGGLFGGSSPEDDHKVEDTPDTPEWETVYLSANEDGDTMKPAGEADDKESAGDAGSEGQDKGEQTGAKEEEKKDAKEEQGEGESDGEQKDDKEKPAKEEEAPKEGGEETGEKAEKSGEGEKAGEEGAKESDKKEKSEKKANSSEKGSEGEAKETEEKKPPKVVSIKEEIKAEVEALDLKDISTDQLKAAKKRLSDLRAADKAKVELEKAQNELEAFIFDFQDKLSQGPHEKCTTEEEREKLNKMFSEASDWLYEQPDDAKKSEYTNKLKSLREATKDVSVRVYEMEERPKALEALRSALNQTGLFMATVKNISDEEDPIFTQVELDTLEKLINDTTKWRDENVAEQKKLALHQMPSLITEDIAQKIAALDREMRYLINKAKNFKPKAKPKEEKKKASNETKTENTTTTESPEPSQEEAPPTEEPEAKPDDAAGSDTPAADSQEKAEAPTTPETPTSDDSGERTSSGKRRPKSKRKSSQAESQEEVLELDAAAGDAETSTEKEAKTDKDTDHVEL
ncbi:hypoxia up-regulated protein 1 [Aplysia californica]|uniref:Hypoxia up-regulated protein 1 n=1 Tax=Aplysia californica TaxID=6500 RepID=A0ABM1W020_APLCA|nr:hypoxia up-regulated protein 1 [Aplysia californica]